MSFTDQATMHSTGIILDIRRSIVVSVQGKLIEHGRFHQANNWVTLLQKFRDRTRKYKRSLYFEFEWNFPPHRAIVAHNEDVIHLTYYIQSIGVKSISARFPDIGHYTRTVGQWQQSLRSFLKSHIACSLVIVGRRNGRFFQQSLQLKSQFSHSLFALLFASIQNRCGPWPRLSEISPESIDCPLVGSVRDNLENRKKYWFDRM